MDIIDADENDKLWALEMQSIDRINSWFALQWSTRKVKIDTDQEQAREGQAIVFYRISEEGGKLPVLGIKTEEEDRAFWTEVTGKVVSSSVSSGSMLDEVKTKQVEKILLQSEEAAQEA